MPYNAKNNLEDDMYDKCNGILRIYNVLRDVQKTAEQDTNQIFVMSQIKIFNFIMYFLSIFFSNFCTVNRLQRVVFCRFLVDVVHSIERCHRLWKKFDSQNVRV